MVHLDGPPVLVRVCLLGQLQHTHLHSPIFPIKLEQELNFERVSFSYLQPYPILYAVHAYPVTQPVDIILLIHGDCIVFCYLEFMCDKAWPLCEYNLDFFHINS